jgi:hypothetical protein
MLAGLLILIGVLLVAFAVALLFPNFRKKLQGWKTIIFNCLLGLGSVGVAVTDYLNTVDLAKFMTPQNVALAGIAIAAVGAFLRYVTTTPLGQKE